MMRVRFKLCPAFSDGANEAIVDDADAVCDAVRPMIDEIIEANGAGFVGEVFTIEVVMMTDAEVAALPDL